MNRDFAEMLSTFSDEKVEFLLVGAYALAVHGVARTTGDLDLWVRPTTENADRVWRALARFGASVVGATRDDFARPGVVVQLGVSPLRIDLLTSIDGVEFEAAWARRAESSPAGLAQPIPVLAREDLITNKRASARPQDLADVARLEAME